VGLVATSTRHPTGPRSRNRPYRPSLALYSTIMWVGMSHCTLPAASTKPSSTSSYPIT